MHRYDGFKVLLLAAVTLMPLGRAHAENTPASGRIWLEGDSTLHPYKSTATSFDVTLEPAPGARGSAAQLLQQHQLRGATLRLMVGFLCSGESKLDANLRDALKAREHPAIVFKVARIDAEPRPGVAFPVKLVGTLSVAGVDQPETVDAQGQLEDGALHLTGRKALKMTDFKVDPPKLMLGTIRCSDAITVGIDVILK